MGPQPQSDRLASALVCLRQGDPEQARLICEQLVRSEPRHARAWELLGLLAMRRADLPQAVHALERSIRAHPEQPQALTNLGTVLRRLGKSEEALRCYDRALALRPHLVEALNNRANALADLKRHAEALDSCDRALLYRSDYPEALNNKGNALRALARSQEALACFERAIQLSPRFAPAFNNRAAALLELQRPAEALADCERALELDERYADACNNRGVALRELRRPEEALASFERAIGLQAAYVEAHVNRCGVLVELGRSGEALASVERALQLMPADARSWCNRGSALQQLNRPTEALGSFERALSHEPNLPAALNGCSEAYAALGRYQDAASSLVRLVAVAPTFEFAAGHLLYCRAQSYDWTDYAAEAARILEQIRLGHPAVGPFCCLALSDSGAIQRQCSAIFAARATVTGASRAQASEAPEHDRIRIAYLSADFRDHPVSRLLAGVFEQHDRHRFQVIAISLSGRDDHPLGRRICAAADRFEDASGMTDAAVAGLIRHLEVDILVDLLGYTQGMRPGVLARRPAPIQVSYLGFPGTMAADFIDYIIADRFTIPSEAQSHYSERVVHLPVCFQANDDRREAGEATTRAQAMLPPDRLVLGSFNSASRVTPQLFDVWARLLQSCEQSVLWIVAETPTARLNLLREASHRGIDGQRLVFAPRRRYREHLARLPLADLYLDTFPFNGGSTVSDALWAGVPVLTCSGEMFASRMAGSLLAALDLPELITASLAHYESVGRELLCAPQRLRELRSRLAINRSQRAVFDTGHFSRHLESAYFQMLDRRRCGERPACIAVEASTAGARC